MTENGKKTQEIALGGLPQTPMHLYHAPMRLTSGKNPFLLVFQVGSADKTQFSSLNP